MDKLNEMLKNDYDLSVNKWALHGQHTAIKALLLVATGIFAGYTLEPVPSKFRDWFSTNPLVKFLNLFIIGLLLSDFTNGKVTGKEILVSFLVAALVIVIFEWMRWYGGETSGNFVAQTLFRGEGTLLQ